MYSTDVVDLLSGTYQRVVQYRLLSSILEFLVHIYTPQYAQLPHLLRFTNVVGRVPVNSNVVQHRIEILFLQVHLRRLFAFRHLLHHFL